MSDRWLEIMFDNFKSYNPGIVDRVVSYKVVGRDELMVTLNDGRVTLFDIMDKTSRYLPKDDDNMSNEILQKEFGRRFRKRLQMEHMTQRELSELTEIPYQLLSDYANGRRNPGMSNIRRIARALNCSIDYLLYND